MRGLCRSGLLALACVAAGASAVHAAPAKRASAAAVATTPDQCRGLEDGRAVLGTSFERITCDAAAVTRALRAGRAVHLEHVELTGTLDLSAALAANRTALSALALPSEQVEALERWLEDRRRYHLAADTLPSETFFVPVTAGLVIRDSQLKEVRAAGMDPLLFLEDVDLRGTRVERGVNFSRAIFRQRVSLEGAVLGARAVFSGAHFDVGADFSRTRFGGETRFERATFGARELSRLRQARSRARTRQGTAALFVSAVFPGPVTFQEAIFDSRATFQKAVFEGTADFGAVRFRGRADFAQVAFGQALEASSAVFEHDALFQGAAFDKAAIFRRAEFRRYADFGLASFGEPATSFREAVFGTWWGWPAGYDFHHARFPKDDKVRTLARARFEVHAGFALVTLLAAGLGAVVCLGLRRPPLVFWSEPAPDAPVAGVVRERDA